MAKDRRRWPRYGRGRRTAAAGGGGGAATKEEPSPAETALAVAPKEFGPSPATVQVSGSPQVNAASQQLFGRNLSNQELASLTGAPAGSNVAVSAYNGQLQFNVTHPNIEAASRTLYRNAQGDLEIHNNIFTTKVTRTGFGSEMVGRQMEQASKLGVRFISTDAAQGAGPRGYIGYHVWPKMGYDGPIPANVLPKLRASNLPSSLRNATNVGELHKSKAGTEWWEKHGDWIKVKFDTKPGSYSMKKMSAYQAERRAARQQ